MPRENRKRGKKHKKHAEEFTEQPAQYVEPVEESQAGPSWIVSAPGNAASNEEAPFGYVDSEVKAYFRTVDVQIREWQEEPLHVTGDDEGDPNEDRRLFFVAALTEMSGKEKELATDPDCSAILERMAYSMDDFARRVFMDRLTGSYKTLVKHRFASHTCQTFLEVAGETITRETCGILPPPTNDPDQGELPLMSDMISDICEELLPDFTDLLMDSFASHVCRALLTLLTPNLFSNEQRTSTLRSKRSAAYKARQGPMKSLFIGNSEITKAVPPKFSALAQRFMESVREKLSANEVRALAASQVASPVLQMLLEIEAAHDLTKGPDSLTDSVLDGLITRIHEGSSAADLEASDYVGTLLRDPTSSHLLETLVRRLPSDVFDVVWAIYLNAKLPRLSVHPVANFVVGKALERVNEKQLAEACEELGPVSEKLFKQSRTGLIRAIVDRVGQLYVQEKSLISSVVQMILRGLELSDQEDQQFVVPCILRLLSKEEYEKAKANRKPKGEESEDRSNRRPRREPTEDPMAPKTQGAVILQSLLRLPAPHSQFILDSIYAQTMEELIAMAHDVTSSRVLDVILTSPSVSFKEKRRFVMHFIGHYHELVDDRIGSRVGDNCWAFADPYLKEKIARSLIPHEHALVGSFYGKFFAKNLNLYLFQRNPEQWKNLQASKKSASTSVTQANKQSEKAASGAPAAQAQGTALAASAQPQIENKKKRKARPENEIDQLFEEKLGKKVKKAELKVEAPLQADEAKEVKKDKKKRRREEHEVKDNGLDAVLGAIKTAPKDEGHHHKKKKAAQRGH